MCLKKKRINAVQSYEKSKGEKKTVKNSLPRSQKKNLMCSERRWISVGISTFARSRTNSRFYRFPALESSAAHKRKSSRRGRENCTSHTIRAHVAIVQRFGERKTLRVGKKTFFPFRPPLRESEFLCVRHCTSAASALFRHWLSAQRLEARKSHGSAAEMHLDGPDWAFQLHQSAAEPRDDHSRWVNFFFYRAEAI